MMRRLLIGDARRVLADLVETRSVHAVVTSPPYYKLRTYGASSLQIGQEPTVEEYVTNLVDVFRQVWRVLRNDGSLWLNLGDSFDSKKNLYGVPWLVAFALQKHGWVLRSDVVWHKLNPTPESVTDRPTRSHEFLFLFTKQPSGYYYDRLAVQEPLAAETQARYAYDFGGSKAQVLSRTDKSTACVGKREMPTGRNRRDVWSIPNQPYKGAHFAVMPEALVEPCILASTAQVVCTSCGAPTRRQTERITSDDPAGYKGSTFTNGKTGITQGDRVGKGQRGVTIDTGIWGTGCGCTEPGLGSNRSVILDPFMGSGTVGVVAERHGRDFIGIDLESDYADLAHTRLATSQKETIA